MTAAPAMTVEQLLWASAVQDLAAAPTAQARRAVLEAAAVKAGVSLTTAYRKARAAGWTSGRAERADKGRSRVSLEALETVAAVLANGRNARGAPCVPVAEAHRIVQELGLEAGQVSYSHLSRQLRAAGLDMATMRAPAPSISRVSRHPNAVHQIDASVAVQWYFRDEVGKKKLAQHMDAGRRFYPNKLENYRALRRVIHRWLLVDHYSGAYWVRYYYTSGERVEDVVDFLWTAWSPKPHPDAFPFRGLPALLVHDRGSALMAGVTQELLRGLDVATEAHLRGNPKAKGAVETAHRHWADTFEGRLAAQPAADLDELNQRAWAMCAEANALRPHSRTGVTRTGLWSTIHADQLRECPDRATFMALARTAPATATLNNYCWLRTGGQTFYCAGPGAVPQAKVQFRMTPLQAPGIRVWDGQGRELTASLVVMDAVSGFPVSGTPLHVWGDPTQAGASIAAPAGQRLAKAVEDGAISPTLPPVWDGLDERVAALSWRPVQGQPFEAPALAPPVLSPLDCKVWVAERLGAPLGTHPDGAWWIRQIGDGLTQEALAALWQERHAPLQRETTG